MDESNNMVELFHLLTNSFLKLDQNFIEVTFLHQSHESTLQPRSLKYIVRYLIIIMIINNN